MQTKIKTRQVFYFYSMTVFFEVYKKKEMFKGKGMDDWKSDNHLLIKNNNNFAFQN
jgi:hypothetical protein